MSPLPKGKVMVLIGTPKGAFRVSPGGKLAVHRSRDAGHTWQRAARGLPDRNAHLSVLREAMSVDRGDVAGIYFGTSTGQLFHIRDEGREWHLMADFFCFPFIRWKRLGPMIDIPFEESEGAAPWKLLRLSWNAARCMAVFGV